MDSCSTLWAKPGLPDLRFREIKRAGPELTGYSALPNEYLAESIIKPHTIVAAPGYTVKEGRAAMGEYNHYKLILSFNDEAVIRHFHKWQYRDASFAQMKWIGNAALSKFSRSHCGALFTNSPYSARG